MIDSSSNGVHEGDVSSFCTDVGLESIDKALSTFVTTYWRKQET
jgi:hypothetical protein